MALLHVELWLWLWLWHQLHVLDDCYTVRACTQTVCTEYWVLSTESVYCVYARAFFPYLRCWCFFFESNNRFKTNHRHNTTTWKLSIEFCWCCRYPQFFFLARHPLAHTHWILKKRNNSEPRVTLPRSDINRNRNRNRRGRLGERQGRRQSQSTREKNTIFWREFHRMFEKNARNCSIKVVNCKMYDKEPNTKLDKSILNCVCVFFVMKGASM